MNCHPGSSKRDFEQPSSDPNVQLQQIITLLTGGRKRRRRRRKREEEEEKEEEGQEDRAISFGGINGNGNASPCLLCFGTRY